MKWQLFLFHLATLEFNDSFSRLCFDSPGELYNLINAIIPTRFELKTEVDIKVVTLCPLLFDKYKKVSDHSKEI